MGANDAINAAASTPISNVVGLTLGTNYRQQQAMQNASNMAQRIYESNEAYQERMAKFREELNKRITAENTTIANNMYGDISKLELFNTNNPYILRMGQNQIQSLLFFTNNNQTQGLNLTAIKNQQAVVEQKLYNLKNNKETNTSTTYGPTLYDGTYQEAGHRDILS